MVLSPACGAADPEPAPTRAGTARDREALFEYLLTATREREAFSPVKNERLGLDVLAAMEALREEVVAAGSEEDLYYALARLSNARRDRHLRIGLVDGGLRLPDSLGARQSNYPDPGGAIPHAPVRVAVDYGTEDEPFLFVGDVGEGLPDPAPAVGDRVVGVNGAPLVDYLERVAPYHRSSTDHGFWWQVATWLPQRSAQFPGALYREDLALELEDATGRRYGARLPYLDVEAIRWRGHGARRYPGFSPAYATDTYTLFRQNPAGPPGRGPVLLLQWHGFQDSLVPDVDRLVTYASAEGLLDAAVIVDATRSRGGSGGPYAVRRLSPNPFRTTFGNLRISDASAAFAAGVGARLRDRHEFPAVLGDGDDGGWLLSWLEEDFASAADRGDRYTEPVPFKLAHLPKNSDGVVQPADTHFRGPLVVWLGPYGGSHLDQFASIVADNGLGYTLGMPAGGYSNTWEWEEVVRFPASGQPVVSFMWTIGHTIRPNGEILEGNPADVDEYLPVTRENHADYYPLLLRRSLEYLDRR